jgi:hypothetical protein
VRQFPQQQGRLLRGARPPLVPDPRVGLAGEEQDPAGKSSATVRAGGRSGGGSVTGYSNRRRLVTLCAGEEVAAGDRPRGDGVAPQRRRSPNDFEQALRRQELAAARGLAQALPADGRRPGARELAVARRVLTQALFDLRRLGRDLDQEIEQLKARRRPGEPAARGRAGAAGPAELDRYEAARNAIDEVIERWEGRREQLSTELERRQPRRPGARRGAGQVSGGRKDGAPARPGPPRSRRSRRSPG